MNDITMANAPDREGTEGEEISTPEQLRSVQSSLRKRNGKDIATLIRYVSDQKTRTIIRCLMEGLRETVDECEQCHSALLKSVEWSTAELKREAAATERLLRLRSKNSPTFRIEES